MTQGSTRGTVAGSAGGESPYTSRFGGDWYRGGTGIFVEASGACGAFRPGVARPSKARGSRVFFPGVRRRAFHLPHAVVTFGLAIGAIGLTLFGWALLAPSNAGNGPSAPISPDITRIKSIAYTSPGTGVDDLIVQPAAPGLAPQVITSFPNDPLTNTHARGAASPRGDRVAIIWLPAFASGTLARLSLVDIARRERIDIEGTVDYFGQLSWSPDGSTLAVTGTTSVTGGARKSVVYEIDAATRQRSVAAEFANALEVAPLGYSFDGTRLYTVVIDQKGSNLHVTQAGKTEPVAELSPGRTAYWALSPDGSRLAFVDILGGGSRNYVGRTLTIATGAITTLPAEKNQYGSTWMPGSPLPVFGGPGGAWQLTGEESEGAYVIPDAWSPDGSLLVATVYSPPEDGSNRPRTAIELITRETASTPPSRSRISEITGASFVGWVTNLN